MIEVDVNGLDVPDDHVLQHGMPVFLQKRASVVAYIGFSMFVSPIH